MSNLPVSSTTFVGRTDELAEIARLLDDPVCRLLTLVGPGGIGKTRLATEAACTVLDLPRNGEDGVCFVQLAPLSSPDFLITAICESLRLTLLGQQYMKAQLFSVLSQKKSLLMVLDNFEHLIEGADLLAEMLEAAAGVKLLVTSRERLNLREEWVMEVGGLAYPSSESEADIEDYSAVQLFMQHAHRANTAFKLMPAYKPTVARICRLVGGMPLGIELAAAWVRALSVEQIADELERSLDILETPARNMPSRHRTMRAAFEPTWERLTDEERSVFKKLSVFRGGFTHEAAQVVAGASLRTLAALVDKSLLRVGASGRYDLHELVRQYAEEQLYASDEAEATRDAYSAFYAAFLQQKWQPLRSHQQVITLHEIDAEFENVRSAWQTMVENRKTTELSIAVYPVWYFTDLRGRYHDALALFKEAEDALRPAAGDTAVDRVIGQMLTRQGSFYLSLGKAEEGRELAQEGLTILQRVGSIEDIVLALDCLAVSSGFLHDLVAAKSFAEHAIEIARQTDDRWLLARSLFNMVYCSVQIGDLQEARRLGTECLDLAQQCGDLWLRSLTLQFGQAGIAILLGEYSDAKRCLEQCLQLLAAIGTVGSMAEAHWELGYVLVCLKDYPGAAYQFHQSLKVLVDHGGYTVWQIEILPYIAELRAAQNNTAGAIELLALALHGPESAPRKRDIAEDILLRLQAQVAPSIFAAAQERGRKLELRTVIQQLMVELSKSAQAVLPKSPLIYPLTERELEILHLIAGGFSNREIADQLVLAESTVKWYNNQIFSKLDAANRTQAVAHARTLGLLS
jgi:predicted ATPase/DNA-binding CsgD family transcriptional regulator